MNLNPSSVEWAIQSIARHGDTDLFPRPAEVVALIEDMAESVAAISGLDLATYQPSPSRRCATALVISLWIPEAKTTFYSFGANMVSASPKLAALMLLLVAAIVAGVRWTGGVEALVGFALLVIATSTYISRQAPHMKALHTLLATNHG